VRARKETIMRNLLTALAAFVIATPLATAGDGYQVKVLRSAEEVLAMSVSAPDRGIPKELLERAECIGVFPGIKKGAFVVGGEFGHGVFTCREKGGGMGAPAFFSLGAGSVGWQFGGQSADLVLLIMNPDGIKHLLKDRFTLGGDAAAVAGPVGRTARAATDAQLHAQILSWSRSRGVFLGAALAGSVVKPDTEANATFYGTPVTAHELLLDHSVPTPASAEPFVRAASKHSRPDRG
jgi:SH3 domain-containing YSC84-like protein 1